MTFNHPTRSASRTSTVARGFVPSTGTSNPIKDPFKASYTRINRSIGMNEKKATSSGTSEFLLTGTANGRLLECTEYVFPGGSPKKM